MKTRYLLFDTETGGLNQEKHSLLTAYFKIVEEDGKFVSDLDLTIAPVDETYHVTARSLGINGIQLADHYAKAMPPGQAAAELREFLRKGTWIGQFKLIPMAHNIKFDLDFIHSQLLSQEEWEQYVSYHKLDTASFIEGLKKAHVLPKDFSTSLQYIAKHFNISTPNAHTAKADVETMEKVWEELEACVAGPKTF